MPAELTKAIAEQVELDRALGAAGTRQRRSGHCFPVRIRLAVPPEGFGSPLTTINGWLDEIAAPTAGR